MHYPQILNETIVHENEKLLLNWELKSEPGTTTKIIADLNKTQKIRLNGFRPGRAPKVMLEKAFGKEKIYIEKITEQYDIARKEKGFYAVTKPELGDFSEESDGSLKFKIKVEVMPDFDIQPSHYLGIFVEKEAVTQEQIDTAYESYLNRIEQQFGSYKPVDRPAENNDQVALTLETTVNNKIYPDLTFTNKLLRLNEGSLGKELAEAIIGNKSEETKELDIVLNDKYPENLKNKTAHIKFTLETVKELINHPRNDELAQQTNLQVKTLDELKNKFTEEHVKMQEDIAQRSFELNCMEVVLKNINLTIPQSLVNDEVMSLIRERISAIENMGLPRDFALKNIDYNAISEQAQKRVAAAIIFEKLLRNKTFNYEDVSKEDLIKNITEKETAKGNDLTEKQIEDTMNLLYQTKNKNHLEALKKEILYNEFVAQVVNSAVPVPKKLEDTNGPNSQS